VKGDEYSKRVGKRARVRVRVRVTVRANKSSDRRD
jgi:hypothetical protein